MSLVMELFYYVLNFIRKIDNGILIDVLIFGESLVVKVFEVVMVEV